MNKSSNQTNPLNNNQSKLFFLNTLKDWWKKPVSKLRSVMQTNWFSFISKVDDQELSKYFGEHIPSLSTAGFTVMKVNSQYFESRERNIVSSTTTDNTVVIDDSNKEENTAVKDYNIETVDPSTEKEVIPFTSLVSDGDISQNTNSNDSSQENHQTDEIIDLSLGKFFSDLNGEDIFIEDNNTEDKDSKDNTNDVDVAFDISNNSNSFSDSGSSKSNNETEEGESNNPAVVSQNQSTQKNQTNKEQTEIVPSVINKQSLQQDGGNVVDYCLANSEKLLFSHNPLRSKTLDIEIKKTAEKLENTIQEFGIKTQVVNVSQGPVITQYELTLEPGVHINKIVSLSDNIALSLAAESIRIVAPIPGKAVIGVEIPNKLREMVTLRDITAKEIFGKHQANLPIALGASIAGEPIITDLSSTPHLLVAGATGSGKSVCVNSIICSLLLKCSPEQVRFIMIDPKMVELNIYNGIPHLLSPVITDSSKAALTLKWAIAEMEARYRLLEKFGVRSISSYNHIVEKNKNKKFEYGTLPYIVIIIDEFADLMMVAKKEIEDSVSRLAAMSRAIGIHLLLATQRPSVDVITGVIKANFPSRIAFQVSSKIDSRTIIDSMGAEKLLGKGDMLFQNTASGNPHRIQGTFLSDEEVREIVSDLKGRRETNYILTLKEELNNNDIDNNSEFQDEVFHAALEIAKKEGKVSASFLQRRLRIGYNRAARIIEMMEERGIVGASDGVKPREVLVSNF